LNSLLHSIILRLNNGALTLTPPGKVANFTFTPVDCNVAEGQICRQRWGATLQLTPDTCTLDGSYRMDWKVGCGAGLTGATCPLEAKDFDSNVQFQLTSENFCAEVSVEVGLIGDMKSYEDAAFTIPKVAYVVGRTAYFQVKVNSDINPAGDYNDGTASVKFAGNLKLVSVTVKQVGTTNVLRVFEKGATANPDEQNAKCTEIPQTSSKVGFKLDFSLTLCKNLQQNSKQSFTVGAEVQVTYGSKKRGIMQATPANEKNTYSADADLEETATLYSTTSGTETKTNNGYVVAISLVLLLISLLM